MHPRLALLSRRNVLAENNFSHLIYFYQYAVLICKMFSIFHPLNLIFLPFQDYFLNNACKTSNNTLAVPVQDPGIIIQLAILLLDAVLATLYVGHSSLQAEQAQSKKY